MVFVGFTLCAAVIFWAGKNLSYYGDMLADKTGIGKAFIGLFLMSAVTSLPELMVGISSVTIVKSADLAVGDVLGSCAFNLLILAIMEFVSRDIKPLLSTVSQSHTLAASLGIVLIGFVGMAIFSEKDLEITSFLGFNSLLFGIIYFFALRLIYNYQQRNPSEQASTTEHNELSTKQVVWRYIGFATVTVAAALFLPHFAEGIAEETGLDKSLVGTLFLAVTTSLPEIAVSIAAVRMNSTELAVGNLLGSNIFNVFILFLDDLFYTQGHLLKDTSDSNLVSVFSVIIMTAVAIMGIIYKSPAKVYMMSWSTLFILMTYLTNIVLLFLAH